MPLVIVSVVVAHVLCARHRRAAEAIDAQVFAEHPAAVSGLGEHPVSGPLLLPRWEQLVLERPVLVATMAPLPEPDRVHAAAGQRQGQRPRAALVRCVGSLRWFAAFLAEVAPEVLTVAAVGRRHIEDYKPWLALRPGPKVPRLTPNTIAHPPWPASSPKPNLPGMGWACSQCGAGLALA
jgi:hypothetical protein